MQPKKYGYTRRGFIETALGTLILAGSGIGPQPAGGKVKEMLVYIGTYPTLMGALSLTLIDKFASTTTT